MFIGRKVFWVLEFIIHNLYNLHFSKSLEGVLELSSKVQSPSFINIRQKKYGAHTNLKKLVAPHR